MGFLKKPAVISLAVILLILIITVAFLKFRQVPQNSTTQPLPGFAKQADKKSILINQTERNKIKQTTPNTNLNYEFSPEFLKRIQPSPTPKNVLGISNVCNLGTVPPSVYVYNLRTHWLSGEADTTARSFGIASIPFSLPSETSAYQYLFTKKDNSAFFTMYEGSGVFTYSQSATAGGSPATQDELKSFSDQFLNKHGLHKTLAQPKYNSTGDGGYTFTYRKILKDFPLVDEASIQSFFDLEYCVITESDIMGLIDVKMRSTGSVAKLVNNTRTITDIFMMKTIPVTVAVQGYKNAQPVDPIIYPSNAIPDPARNVVIDAAVIAYYDVGLNFSQNLYVPIYIAHGFTKSTTGQDVQILTFFPAVSADDLVSKGLVRTAAQPGNAATQQQGELGFATPTPHMPPAFPTNNPATGISGPGCPSNVVDYLVSCSVDGRIMCRGYISTIASNDAMGVCAAGCSAKVSPINVTGGINPCDAIIKQNNIPGAAVTPGVPRQRIAPDGDVSCVIDACPS